MSTKHRQETKYRFTAQGTGVQRGLSTLSKVTQQASNGNGEATLAFPQLGSSSSSNTPRLDQKHKASCGRSGGQPLPHESHFTQLLSLAERADCSLTGSGALKDSSVRKVLPTQAELSQQSRKKCGGAPHNSRAGEMEREGSLGFTSLTV